MKMKEYIKKRKTLDLGMHDRGKGKNGDMKWDLRMRLKTEINPNKNMLGGSRRYLSSEEKLSKY